VARLGADLAWAGGRSGLDVTDAAAVERLLAEVRPEVVFNAAAWNAVDLAEARFAEALLVNAAGPAHLARAARACGARLVGSRTAGALGDVTEVEVAPGVVAAFSGQRIEGAQGETVHGVGLVPSGSAPRFGSVRPLR